ncbi:protein FAM210A isoform X1 [Apteryx mantelli]|uniref:Protein FAM210A isoform X1 n=1 Tax=Apteryx mantelli TaxID=2696672 RepID=A0ABM4E2E3_9AVES
MQRSVLQTASQLAHGTCLFFSPTNILQCLKEQSVSSNVGCKAILALGPPKRCHHAGAALFASKKSVFSSQPANTPHKVPEERNALTSASDIPKQSPVESDSSDPDPLQDKSISLFQRFKKTFKQYGKVMIPVHLLTSTVWFGSFYYAAMNYSVCQMPFWKMAFIRKNYYISYELLVQMKEILSICKRGVNVVPFLELIGLPDSIVNILKNSQSGNALTAYALYKIATPARYTVTLGGTSITVKYLRKSGYMSTPPPVKEYLQDRMEETKDKITEKMEETKDKITEKIQETKDKVSFKKIKD